MYRLLGAEGVDKLHCVFDAGHIPADPTDHVRVTLDWLDRYLGPVGSGQLAPPAEPVRCGNEV